MQIILHWSKLSIRYMIHIYTQLVVYLYREKIPIINYNMTQRDLELIDEAYSTTYRSTIRELIKEADTEECRKILRNLLDDIELTWED